MSLGLENANKTWQRVNIALANASPWAKAQFKALKQALAQDYRNKDLTFVVIDPNQGSDGANADTVVAGEAARLVAVYVKKGLTATGSYVATSNHATALQAGKELILRLNAASEEAVFVEPAGSSYATGIVLAGVTAYNGTTKNTIAASPSGFALICAP
jgi:hypothetical protein